MSKPVRLNLAAAQLNVSSSRIVEFLSSIGMTVDNNPNTKLEGEVYELLLEEFAADASVKQKSKQTSLIREKKETSLSGTNSIGDIKKSLEDFFDLSISNNELFAAGEVAEGNHGVEIVNGEYYASLYHIQNHIAKGELKEFLMKYKGTMMMAELGAILKTNYDFQPVLVKYTNPKYSINKYPYSVIMDFFFNETEQDDAEVVSERKISVENFESSNSKEQFDTFLERFDLNAEKGLGIGFSNFRRFERLENLNLGKITFLVGKNNAGKSTLVKAILLVLNYFNESTVSVFPFGGKIMNDVNIVTFDRAVFNNDVKKPLRFDLKIDNYCISILMHGNEGDTIGNVQNLQIFDSLRKIYFNLDLQTKEMIYVQLKEENEDDSISLSSLIYVAKQLKDFENKLKKLKDKLSKLTSKLSKEGLILADEINKTELKIKNLSHPEPDSLPERDDIVFTYDFSEKKEKLNIFDMVRLFEDAMEKEYNFYNQRGIESFLGDEERENYQLQRKRLDDFRYSQGLKNSIEGLKQAFEREVFFYLGSNPTKQSALFFVRDTGNALAQAIHDFKANEVEIDDEFETFVKTWIKTWMRNFEVGEDFQIELYAGEAYEFFVKTKIQKRNLADMGMGSIQIMMILLRIATIIRMKKIADSKEIYTILVEEPEQNLHPMLQSKLTDLFYTVNKDFGIKFVVETHSEYIIRKTQNIGKEKNLFLNSYTNPFTVFYFDDLKGPYKMVYRKDGKFTNSFGSGFTDVSSSLIYELL